MDPLKEKVLKLKKLFWIKIVNTQLSSGLRKFTIYLFIYLFRSKCAVS